MAKLCRCHAADGLLSAGTMADMLARLACTQLRCQPSQSLPVQWWGLGRAHWSKVVSLFDPLDSDVVDWREWVVALALPPSLPSLPLDRLQALRAQLEAVDEDKDGCVTWNQLAGVPVFYPDAQAPQELAVKQVLFRTFFTLLYLSRTHDVMM